MSKKTQEESIKDNFKRIFKDLKCVYDSEEELFKHYLKFKEIYIAPENAFFELYYFRLKKLMKNQIDKIFPSNTKALIATY